MAHNNPSGPGIWKHKAGSSTTNPADVKVAEFSYENEEIAAMIVRAWTDNGFLDGLVGNHPIAQRTANAQAALLGLPIHPIGLAEPIVITEDEYYAGWESDDDNQVVFVLPNGSRQVGNLVESAKLLMANTPNGI